MEGTDSKITLSLDDDKMVVVIPEKFKIGYFPLDYVYDNADCKLSYDYFKIIVEKSIEKDTIEVQYVVNDKYPENILIQFYWTGILSGKFQWEVSYRELEIDKKSIASDNPGFVMMVEHLESELARLGLKDSRIIKEETFTSEDLIDFRLVTRNDIKEFLYMDRGHSVSNCTCRDDKECVSATLMTAIKSYIWNTSDAFVTNQLEIDEKSEDMFSKLEHILGVIRHEDRKANIFPVVPILETDSECLTVTRLTKGMLNVNGIIYLSFDNYKKSCKGPHGARQNCISMLNWERFANSTYKICNFRNRNVSSDYGILKVNVYNNYCATVGVVYRLEIIDNILVLKTYGSVYTNDVSGQGVKWTYCKGFDMSYINRAAGTTVVAWNSAGSHGGPTYALNNLYINTSNGVCSTQMPLFVEIKKIELS